MDLQDQLKNIFPDNKFSESSTDETKTSNYSHSQSNPLIRKYEKRNGRPTIIIDGFENIKKPDIKLLAKKIKQKFSVGGSVKDYTIIIQGNIRVEIKIQSKEIGANISDPDGGDFTLTVSPVAKMPTLTDANSLSRNGVEDNVTKISDGLIFSTDDSDGSESIVAVTISNVQTGFALVNSSGEAVGISDGAGSIT